MSRHSRLSNLIAAAIVLGCFSGGAARGAVSPSAGEFSAAVKVQTELEMAERIFSTGPGHTLEILFADGTALTLAANTRVVVESYRYDRDRRTGSMRLRIERGLLRVAGGVLNNSGPIVVETPAGRVDIANASAIVEVGTGGGTRASLLFGSSLTLTSGGKSETLIKPGFQVATLGPGQPPGAPVRMDAEAVEADAYALNPQLAPAVGGPGNESELSARLSAAAEEDGAIVNTPPEPNVTPPEPSAMPPVRPRGLNIALNDGLGFGVGPSLGTVRSGTAISTQLTGQPQNSLVGVLIQTRETVGGERGQGPTSNRLYKSGERFTQSVNGGGNPGGLALRYAFVGIDSLQANAFALSGPGQFQDPESYAHSGGGGSFAVLQGRFTLVRGNLLPESGQIQESIAGQPFIKTNGVSENASMFGDSVYRFLQTGFSPTLDAGASDLSSGDLSALEALRAPDNFLLVEISPAVNSRTSRDVLRDDFVVNGAITNLDEFVRRIARGLTEIDCVQRQQFECDETRPLFDEETGTETQITIGEGIELENLERIGAVKEALAQAVLFAGPLEQGLERYRASGALDGPFAAFVKEALGGGDIDLGRSTLDKVLAGNDGPDALRAGLARLDIENAPALLGAGDVVRLLQRGQGSVLPDPVATESYFFAAGDVDGTLEPAFSVDRFFVSAGLDGFEEKGAGAPVAAAIRAFLRRATALGLPLTDSGVLVVNHGPVAELPEAVRARVQNGLLHVDFGLQGEGVTQKSTLSVTLGEVRYEDFPENGAIKTDVFVNGRTVGSSRDNSAALAGGAGLAPASVAFSSPIFSTAVGGGNRALDKPGRAGYLVLENYDPEDPERRGGTESPVGDPQGEARYAFLRLATATGSTVPVNRSANTWNGWAAGLSEFENPLGVGIAQIDSGESASNVSIDTDPTTNRLVARLDLIGAFGVRPLTLGGLLGDDTRGASVFVDDDRFAARTTQADADVAMVSSELVKAGMLAAMREKIPEYKHLKWGHFLGDTLTRSSAEAAQREHVHLGTWVAGRVPDEGQLALRGAAVYRGHAIGNVFSNGSLHTAVGTFDNQWDFDKRTGTVDMNFDGTAYTGNTRIDGQGPKFVGRLEAAQRIGGLHGTFVDDRTSTIEQPQGEIGRFSIQETGGPVYRASGSFAAEK